MDTFDLVIQGNIVLSDEILQDGYLAVSQGKIKAVGSGVLPKSEKIFDAHGLWVLPGIIDGHVHSGSQVGGEGILGTTKAAAAGGVTTIVDMPYDDPQPVTNALLFEQKVAIVNQTAYVDVALFGTMTKENGVPELSGLVRAGACAFKLSTYETHPNRFPRISPQDLFDAFTVLAKEHRPCHIHCESQEIVDTLLAKVKENGWNEPTIHNFSRPPLSESLAIAEVYEIGITSGANVHVVHCSIDRGIELCQAYRQQGLNASIETCIHYLTLSENDLNRLGAKAKVNPPLRSNEEVKKLWKQLAAGRINFVASDHVAWGLERKNNPIFLQNSSGFPGLESLLPAFFTGCMEHGLPVNQVARYLSENPARHFGLYPQKGAIRVGADADITILEEGEFIFDAAKAHTNAGWSPYDGAKFLGKVAGTFVRGKQVWDGQHILSEPGFGRFIRPIDVEDTDSF